MCYIAVVVVVVQRQVGQGKKRKIRKLTYNNDQFEKNIIDLLYTQQF